VQHAKDIDVHIGIAQHVDTYSVMPGGSGRGIRGLEGFRIPAVRLETF